MCYDIRVSGSQVQLRVGYSPGSQGSWRDWVPGKQLSDGTSDEDPTWAKLFRPAPLVLAAVTSPSAINDFSGACPAQGHRVQLTALLQALLGYSCPGLPISSDKKPYPGAQTPLGTVHQN